MNGSLARECKDIEPKFFIFEEIDVDTCVSNSIKEASE
jgi:hypothetical protein